ncbi:MAG: ribosomal protein methyltransferase [Holophagaceae bacterium]|nr:ribosomal protein methyltransferase [Holophagaceae bacterium]
MVENTLHTRWRLEVPVAAEDRLCAWLDEQGASAYYREVDAPFTFYAYFPPHLEVPSADGLKAFEGVKLQEAETFADEDWLEKSREGFGSFDVAKGFYIKPLWDEAPSPVGRTPIVVNPGLAFGTGGHETTRLCMEHLETLAEAGRLEGPILDIGAGTGILALTAFLLGAKDVTAFDADPDCGPAMEELVELNQDVLQGRKPYDSFVGLLDNPRVNGPYSGLLANILLITIQELLPRMAEITRPGSWLVASGILAEQQDEALLSLVSQGFQPKKMLQEGAWVAILAERMP